MRKNPVCARSHPHNKVKNVQEIRRCTEKKTTLVFKHSEGITHRRTHFAGCIHRCSRTLSRSMNMYPSTRASAQAIYADGAHCKALSHTHTHTHHQALVVTDIGWNIARKKALSFLFDSLCILACLSLYTVWPCHRSGFFSLPVPL